MTSVPTSTPASSAPASGGGGGGAGGPLAHIPLFSRLSETEQTALCDTMRLQRIDAHQTIFWRGDRGEGLYIINEGEVQITVPSDAGEHVHIKALGPGEFFGEISLLDGGPRTATVRTTKDTSLYFLPRDEFLAFIRQRPEAAIEILAVVGERQRASTESLRALRNPNAEFAATRITLWQRASDIISRTAASQHFTMFHATWFGLWIVYNVLAGAGVLPWPPFDPFPFGLLTMVVSLEAIFLAIFVMVSQNRQTEKDRLRTDLDYQVNVKAQTQVMTISQQLDRIEAEVNRLRSEPPSPRG